MAKTLELIDNYKIMAGDYPWPWTEKNLQDYVTRSLKIGIPYIDEPSCALKGGQLRRINVRDFENGQDLYEHSWISICLPSDFDDIPDVIFVSRMGDLIIGEYKHTSLWNIFVGNMVSMWGSKLFRVTSAIIITAMLGPEGELSELGRAFSGTMTAEEIAKHPLLAYLNDAVKWFKKNSTKFTEKWQKDVDIVTVWYQKHGQYYVETVEKPFISLQKQFLDTVNPFVQDFKKAFEYYDTSIKEITETTKKAKDFLDTPYGWLDKKIIVPYNKESKEFLQKLDNVAHFLNIFGIKEANELKDHVKKRFDYIGNYVFDPLTQDNKYVLKIETKFDDFKDLFFKPLQKDMDRIRPMVDAVILLEEKQAAEEAKLKNIPFQRTVKAAPEETMISFHERHARRKIVKWEIQPVIELHNTTADYYVDMLKDFGKNLYTDDNGKPFNSVIGRDGKYTTDANKILGHVVAVSDALSTNTPNWQEELEARINMLTFGLRTAQFINCFVSWDTWVKTGKLYADEIHNTVLYAGAFSIKFFEYLTNMEIGTESYEDLVNQERILDEWILEEIHNSEKFWQEQYENVGYKFYFSPLQTGL